MSRNPNALRWDGQPGHYEVHYVTLTDPESGVGLWIRYTMLAPTRETGQSASCALWFVAVDPRAGGSGAPRALARKATFEIDRMSAQADPFELRIADAVLSDERIVGGFEDVEWDLRWTPSERRYQHVHPILGRLGVPRTVLVLPHADLSIDGTAEFGGRRLELAGARGGQAHLWGSKHAGTWAWAHCNDLRTLAGEAAHGSFVDAVSVFVPRFGRNVGPSTPVVARIDHRDFRSVSLPRVFANHSTFALTGWRLEAAERARKLVCEIDADREQLVGVTYRDPDGELAYCYNSESASMRVHVYERARQVGGWAHRETLVGPGRAHFEYGARDPVSDVELMIK